MKSSLLLVTLFFSFLTSTASAQARVTCSAADKGWEEHFSGHRDCGECLRKHGSCVETCSLEFYTCEVRGADYWGNSITLKGSGDDRYEAERNALRHCQRNFKNCSVSSCNSSTERLSQQECPRPEPRPEPKPEPRPEPKPEPRPEPKPEHPKPPRPNPVPGRPGRR